MLKKVVIQGKVDKQSSNKKFKVRIQKSTEVDTDIEILEDGEYEVDKLSVDELPKAMPDGTPIHWLNNFAVRRKGKEEYINQPYKVTIPGLGKGRVVILDNNSEGKPYYFTGAVVNDTIELSDGDPGIGQT